MQPQPPSAPQPQPFNIYIGVRTQPGEPFEDFFIFAPLPPQLNSELITTGVARLLFMRAWPRSATAKPPAEPLLEPIAGVLAHLRRDCKCLLPRAYFMRVTISVPASELSGLVD